MRELNDFYNDGFGWICRTCEHETSKEIDASASPRLMMEGEAESKSPQLSSTALAKWADTAQTILVCPRCGITETVDQR